MLIDNIYSIDMWSLCWLFIRIGVLDMHSELDIHQKARLETLKQLYIGKYIQLNKANASLNDFKYQILQAELLVLKAAIPEHELPIFIEN